MPMLSHADIIDRADGPAAVSRKISLIEQDAGRPSVDPNTTKAWKRTDSIPSAYWHSFKEAGLATLDELASAAAEKRRILAEPIAAQG
jgi:hypothetical protein